MNQLFGNIVEEESHESGFDLARELRAFWFGPGFFVRSEPRREIGAQQHDWHLNALSQMRRHSVIYGRSSTHAQGVLKRPPIEFSYPIAAFDFGGDKGTVTTGKKNAPPDTIAGLVAVKFTPPSGINCAISIEVLKDDTDSVATAPGETRCWWRSDIKWVQPKPVYEQIPAGSMPTVSKVDAPQVTAVLQVQTTYRTATIRNNVSAYGRGTTTADVKKGDITLGFHESCHREDFVTYLKTKDLPKFDGAPGMFADDFNRSWGSFTRAFMDLPTVMLAWSKAQTDEVGFPKTKWDAQQAKKHKKAAHSAGQH